MLSLAFHPYADEFLFGVEVETFNRFNVLLLWFSRFRLRSLNQAEKYHCNVLSHSH